MKASEIVNNIKNFCTENADEKIIKKYSYYFKGEYNVVNSKFKIISFSQR